MRNGSTLPFKSYALLGDDVVICDSGVVKHYMAIMDELGVEISESKTHTSATMFEFAKRWIYEGAEVTSAGVSS